MSFRVCTREQLNEKESFVSIYNPIAGWKYIIYTWDKEIGGYHPWNTGYLAFDNPESAANEGLMAAECEEIPFVFPEGFQDEPWAKEMS